MEKALTYEGKELIVKPRVNETFAVLNNINVNNKIKTKMGLNYLSWAYAWGELLKNYPDATFNVYNRTIETAETITTEDKENGVSRTVINKSTQEVPYFTDGRTCFVKVGVTVNGIEYVEIIGDAACGGICTDYVGDVIPLREAELGDDLPPYHPNCACSFCAYTEFEDITDYVEIHDFE